jgi:uncharacterized protein (TIGR02117 family)
LRYLLFLFIAITLTTGCRGPIKDLYPPAPDAPGRDVFIVNNHWHTGFVLPYAELSPALKRILHRFESERFVEIGWGDEEFYRAPKNTSGLAMRALFASRGSVCHVSGLDDDPTSHYAGYLLELYRVRVSEAGYARLMRFLESTFQSTGTGEGVELHPGLYGYSYFLAARGRYGALHTCNNWTADGLRATGFPITPGWSITADNVGWQIRTFGRKHQPDIVVQRQ